VRAAPSHTAGHDDAKEARWDAKTCCGRRSRAMNPSGRRVAPRPIASSRPAVAVTAFPTSDDVSVRRSSRLLRFPSLFRILNCRESGGTEGTGGRRVMVHAAPSHTAGRDDAKEARWDAKTCLDWRSRAMNPSGLRVAPRPIASSRPVVAVPPLPARENVSVLRFRPFPRFPCSSGAGTDRESGGTETTGGRGGPCVRERTAYSLG
jgi:hypothetical protein